MNKKPHAENFYEDFFNSNQSVLGGWRLRDEFSKTRIEAIHEQAKLPNTLRHWITAEISAVMTFFPECDIDHRRFYSQYNKSLTKGEVVETEKLPSELYFIISGMLFLRKIEEVSKENFEKSLDGFPDLLMPNKSERSTPDTCADATRELDSLRNSISSIVTQTFYRPLPQKESYQGFVFAVSVLYDLLKLNIPLRRKPYFQIFTLLWFKTLLSLSYGIPFEYPLLKELAFHTEKLEKLVQSGLEGPFITRVFTITQNALGQPPALTSFPFHYTKQQILARTKAFEDDELHKIANEINNYFPNDGTKAVYTLIKQAAIGLQLAERVEDKKRLTKLLRSYIPPEDLALLLGFIGIGLNCYSNAWDNARTLSANETKRKNCKF